MKEINTFADYMADESRVTPEERRKIDFEVELIGKMIEAREKKGYSQRELAELSGVKQPAIARMESLKSTPQIDTLLKILYLNGTTAKATVDLEIREKRYEEFTAVLRELTGYVGALKLYGNEEQLAQKFASFFPEQTSDQERVAAFLSQDAALIRQDYIQTFSPPPDHRKKKRSGRKRE